MHISKEGYWNSNRWRWNSTKAYILKAKYEEKLKLIEERGTSQTVLNNMGGFSWKKHFTYIPLASSVEGNPV